MKICFVSFNKASLLVGFAVVLLSLVWCNDSVKYDKVTGTRKAPEYQANKLIPPVDTVGSYKLAGFWIKPKKLFGFNDSARLSGDTLFLVACSKYVYYPFGDIRDESSVSKSVFSNFDIKDVVENDNDEGVRYYKLAKNDNKMLLLFIQDNNNDDYWGSYIVEGEIKDSSISLINGIRVGTPMNEFYSQFFEEFDKDLQAKVRFVVLEPCVSTTKRTLLRMKN